MSWDHWLAEIDAHNGSSAVTLYYANGNGFVTSPSDSPANTYYDARIKQPVNVQRALFTPGSTQGGSRIGFGELVLLNGDGALDVLNGYGFDGRDIRILRSKVRNPEYSDFEVALVGTMEQAEFQTDVVRIKLRDNRFQLARKLQTTKYAGSGLGTLEGADDLKGKPKPVCFGTVKNVKPPLVETAKLIYQVSDGDVASIDSVYDRGVELLPPFAWSPKTVDAVNTPELTGMVYDEVNELWCLIGYTFIAAVYTPYIYTSANNGTAWTSRSAAVFGAAGLRFIKYADGVLLITDNAGKTGRSTDGGVTWTIVTTGITVDSPPVYHNGLWVVSNSSTLAAVSTDDGVNWTTYAWASPSIGSVVAMLSGNGFILAVGVSGWASSTDGQSWISELFHNIPDAFVFCADYDEANGVFVMGGDDALVATSETGQAWIIQDGGFPASGAGSIVTAASASGPVLLLGAGVGGSKIAWSSDNGETWQQLTLPSVTTVQCLGYGNGVWMAGGPSGTLDVTESAEYASSADLLDDTKAPAPGSYKTFLDASGSYFRLGATPAGEVTADVTQGAAAADRTTAQVFEALLARESITPTAGDLTALDTADNAVIGFWTDEEAVVAEIADAIAQSIGASWYIDKDSAFRIKQLTLASGTAAIELTANDIIGPPIRLTTSDVGHGLPVYRVIVRWGKNYTVQTSDLAAGVAASRRAFLAAEWRTSKAEDTAILTKHLLAPELTVETLLQEQADADAEASRLLTLRKTQRDRIVVTVPFTSANAAIDLMDVVKLTHDRLGLSGGKLFRLMSIEANADTNKIRWGLWG